MDYTNDDGREARATGVRHAARSTGHRPTGVIAIVALDGVCGSPRDLSSASARARHQLDDKKWTAIDQLKPLLLHGGAGEPPTVPHDAILLGQPQ